VTSTPFDSGLEIQPYPGLRPFREDETHLYFGREQHRGELLKRLATTRFVAVIGTSGSGKSSLVRAGLLPDLLSGYVAGCGSDWAIVETTPGADPIGRMAAAFMIAGWTVEAAALRTNSSQILDVAAAQLSPGQHLLVLVDQFEELFRLKTSEDPAADADEKAAFVRLLLNAGGQRADMTAQYPQVHVVMAMRSEFLGRASVYRGLPEAIDQGQYLIPRLSREQLRKAIESPARVAGGEVEEALVQRLLNELGDDQDQLPVLQHALMRCWQLRSGEDRIGLAAYEKSGELANALSLDANEALAETRATLGARGEDVIKRAFQALRETDVNGGQTRRPTTAQDLCELAECTTDDLTVALAPFRRRSFVLPPPDLSLASSTLVDISHEALLRRWDALKRWIDEDELDRTRYLRLATRAAEERGSERPQYLVPPQLDLLVKFWADRRPPRVWALRHHAGYDGAKAFLEESQAHRRRYEQEKANHQAEESRQKQALADALAKRTRTRTRAVVGLALGVVLLVGGSFALQRARVQTHNLETALIPSRAATVPEADIRARLQLAAELVRRQSDLESWSGLLKTLFIGGTVKPGWASRSAEDVVSVALSPRNQRLYAVSDDRLRVLEPGSEPEHSEPLRLYPGYEASGTNKPFLLPSGDKLLVLLNRSASVVDGTTLRILTSQRFDATAFTVSADGAKAAFLASDEVILCDLASNCRSGQHHNVKDLQAEDLELSPDGTSLAIISRRQTDGEARRQVFKIALFDTMPWKLRKSRVIPAVDSKLAMSVDKGHLHLCTQGALLEYNAHDDSLDGREARRFTPQAEHCRFFGERTVTSHLDGVIRVWDETGTLITQATARVNDLRRLALGEGTLVAGTRAGVQAWDIAYGRVSESAKGLRFVRGNTFAYSRDADQLIALESGTTTAGPPLQLSSKDAGSLVAYSDSLALVAFSSGKDDDPEIRLAELREGQAPHTRAVIHPAKLDFSRVTNPQITISPDDRHVAIWGQQRSGGPFIRIVDADGKPVKALPGSSWVFFAPGDMVLSLNGTEVQHLSLKDDQRLSPIKGNYDQAPHVAFSSDGRFLALTEPLEQNGGGGLKVYEWPGLNVVGSFPHAENVTSLAFGPEGSALLTSTSDGVSHVWDVATQKETLRIPAPGRQSSTAAFTPSGRIAILDDSGVTVLPANRDDFVAEACRRIGENLNRQEWEKALGKDITYQRTCPDRPIRPLDQQQP